MPCTAAGTHALVGVEKGGLAWAGKLEIRGNIPIVYHNLELYLKDDPTVRNTALGRRLERAEEVFHKRCQLTIVQDEARGAALFNDNGVTSAPVVYLPVSRLGPPLHEQSDWLCAKLNLSADLKILLVHGLISESRLSVRLGEGRPGSA